MRIIEQAILALYIPIVFFSGRACWLYITRALWPSIQHKTFRLERHAVAVAATAALLAHFIENTYYGVIRIDDEDFGQWMSALAVIAPMKLIILFGSILAVAVYNKAVFGVQNLMRLNLISAGMWLASWALLLYFN